MKTLRPILLTVFLALPVVGVLALVAEKQIAISQSTTVRLPIEGYDPRNLMYGHYLRFRFVGPNAPDNEAHDYFIPEAYAKELNALLSPLRSKERVIELEIRFSGKRVVNYGMLYVDHKPWYEYFDNQRKPLPLKTL